VILHVSPLTIDVLSATSLIENAGFAKPQAAVARISVLGLFTANFQRETGLTSFQ
jgi:hypothetical protein